MKRPRSTILLIGLFLGGLALLWGLERAGVLTEAERDRRRGRVLPELLDVKESDVQVVEIVRDTERLVFERHGPRRWRMREPFEVEAAPEWVDRLISMMKGLRKSPEAGPLEGPDEAFGLAPPAAVVRLRKSPTSEPIATLEVGRTVQEERFVRAGTNSGVEVAARVPLTAVDRPAVDWRETSLLPAATFPIIGLKIRRPGLDVTLDRGPKGNWSITDPIRFPADEGVIAHILESITSARVDTKTNGFVDPAATELAQYGLAEPEGVIEVSSPALGADPMKLWVGSSPDDRPGFVYVAKDRPNDVVLVEKQLLTDIPTELNPLRSSYVVDIPASSVERIEIDASDGPFQLIRKPGGGWTQEAPEPAPADRSRVDSFLNAVEGLQATEFLAPGFLVDPGVSPPQLRIRLWESLPAGGSDRNTSQVGGALPPALDLAIGRHDLLLKSVLAQRAGDDAILTLPEAIVSVLPTNRFAFRNRDLPGVSPTSITRLNIRRPGRVTVIEPDASGAPNRWRMIEPVQAAADARAAAAALVRLGSLRADAFIAESDVDLQQYGLDSPLFEVEWESQSNGESAISSGSLRVGSAADDEALIHYALLTGVEAVFTIDSSSLLPFTAEFHDTRVLRFPPDEVRRLVLRTPQKSFAFTRRLHPVNSPSDWTPEAGTPLEGMDLSRFNNLIDGLGNLDASRFFQYEGVIPEIVGLHPPRLTIEVHFGNERPPSIIRFGASGTSDNLFAAVGEADSGPVFLLPSLAWEALIQGVEATFPPVPDDPFAPPSAF